MGRQSSLATLALGRSPFQEPELEEDGTFVLGPHAHDLDNHDHYIQDFDDRGHPRNRASTAAARKLRNAQNDVLKTMGVVIGREEAAKTARQLSSDGKKIDAIVNENEAGLLLVVLGEAISSGLTWWPGTLRRRVQVYHSYSRMSLWSIVQSELRILGPWTFFTAGMLASFLEISEFITRKLVESLIARPPSHRGKARDDTGEDETCQCRPCIVQKFLTELTLSTLFRPNYMFSALQQLHLIPASAIFPWRTLLLWDAGSPLRTLDFPTAFTYTELVRFAKVSWLPQAVLEYLFEELHWRLDKCIHQVLVCIIDMPDNPDSTTRKISYKLRSRKGIGMENRTAKLRSSRTRNLLTEFRHQFWLIDRAITFFVGLMQMPTWRWRNGHGGAWKLSVVDELLPPPFWEQNASRQREYVRNWPSDLTNDPVIRIACQRQAVSDMFRDHCLSPPEDIDRYLLSATDVFDLTAEEEVTGAAVDGENETIALVTVPSGSLPEEPAVDTTSPLESTTIMTEEQQQNVREVNSEEVTAPVRSIFITEEITEMMRGNRAALTRLSGLAGDRRPPYNADLLGARARRSSSLSEVSEPPRARAEFQGSSVANLGSLDPANNTAGAGTLLPNRNASQTTTSVNGAGTGPTDFVGDAVSNDVSDEEETSSGYQDFAEDDEEHQEDDPLLTASEALHESPQSHGRRADLSQANNAREARNRRLARLRGREVGGTGLERSRPLWGGRRPAMLTQSDIDSARDFLRKYEKKHRITALSTHPGDTFADHLGSLLATIILLPLEALMLRSLVSAFLAHPADRPGAAAAAFGLRADLRPLTGWFGGGDDGWMGRVRYAGLITLAVGLQGAVSSIGWGVASGVAIWLGKGYGWGRL